MKQNLITDIIQGMLPYLNNAQGKRLQEVLQSTFVNYEITENTGNMKESERDYVEIFLAAKRIEGCSEKSLRYYKATIEAMLATLDKNVEYIVTDDIREYLTQYQQKNDLSKVTIDNIRRILSSFFSWLEDEDYILKNPVRRIHKVKTGVNIKETYSDEALELMRDNCQELRDLAMIDMLASTGMRVGEMVLLNQNDIDFNERECIVFGKGSKERVVYFDARTKIHLQNYLDSRNDNLEQQAQAVYYKMFSEVNGEPVELSSIIDVRDGTHDSPKAQATGYYLITSKHLLPFGVDKASANRISKADFDKINERSLVETQDILMSMIGTIGLISYIPYEAVDFAIKNMALFKTSHTPELTYYFLCYLKSEKTLQHIEKCLAGSTQKYISLGELRKMPIYSPTTDEIREFNYLVKPMFEEIVSRTYENALLAEMRDTLLPKLMSGELDVSDIDL